MTRYSDKKWIKSWCDSYMMFVHLIKIYPQYEDTQVLDNGKTVTVTYMTGS